MSINRTAWAALVDDDGSNTVGTVWTKALVASLLLDPIDAAIATVQTTTSTGTQNDFALSANTTLLRCNNASLLTLTGLVAGSDGQLLTIESVGAGQVDITHQGAGSTAGYRCNNITPATISLAPVLGSATFVYDAVSSRWRLLRHTQGAMIAVPYAAGNYTASAGTWTVDAGDVTTHAYLLDAPRKLLYLVVSIVTSTLSTAGASPRIALPAGCAVGLGVTLPTRVADNFVNAIGLMDAGATLTYLQFYKDPAAAGFGTTANSTNVQGAWWIPLQ